MYLVLFLIDLLETFLHRQKIPKRFFDKNDENACYYLPWW